MLLFLLIFLITNARSKFKSVFMQMNGFVVRLAVLEAYMSSDLPVPLISRPSIGLSPFWDMKVTND